MTGNAARIEGGEYNHIVNVLRLKEGDEIALCLNDGLDRAARIAKIDKKHLTAAILKTEENRAESPLNCALFQALVKGDKLEFIAQKATELGVKRIVPFVSAFTTVKPETARTGRLQAACIEAAKQCGRARTPEIDHVLGFKEAVAALKAYSCVIFPYENERERSIIDAIETVKSGNADCMVPCPPDVSRSVAVVIGGEGGFSDAEAEELKAVGAAACSLGKRILRAETAAVVATGIVMNALERLAEH
ncbi:ribosomal RNA small subunit methyltransferase E [Clostridia bacterium]|nr:ribosomal RNA small subunit methyltransferase E [Clostridia bacterium]